ncbi:PKD domain-containing protein, partial [Pyxidicoccus sp. 3LG]
GSLTWQWEQVAGPSVTLTGADTPEAGFTTPDVSVDTTLTFRLTVWDGPRRGTDEVDVLVRKVNRAPVAAVGLAQAVDERTLVTLQGGGEDPDGDVLTTFRWTQVSGPSVTLTWADSASPAFTAPDIETATADLVFQFVVGDGGLDSAAATVTVTVRDVPVSPEPQPEPRPGEQDTQGCSATGTPAALPLALLLLALLARRRRVA